MEEALRLEVLNIAVKRREVMTLRRLVTEYKIPQWHPCICPDTSLSDLSSAYLERLLETDRKALLPIIVVGHYVLTSTCLLLTAANLRTSEYLDNIKVEVWSLGEYREEDKFAVMALATELCKVHEDKGDRDIKLEFAKELVKAFIVDIAKQYGAGHAMKIIEELAQGFHVLELAKVLARYVKTTPRAAENYVRAVTLDEQFMDELRKNVIEHFGNVGNNTSKTQEDQNNGATHEETSYGQFPRKSRNPTEDREGHNPLAQITTETEDSIKRRIALSKLRKFDSNIDESLLQPLSANDLVALARVVTNKPTEEGREFLNKVTSLLREGKIGEVKAMIHGKPRPTTNEEQPQLVQPTQGINNEEGEAKETKAEDKHAFKREFEFTCSEDICNHIRELSRASLRSDTKAMLDASLALASALANSLGMGSYAKLLGIVSRRISNAKLMNLLLAITELAEENPPITWAIADAIRAVKEGNLRELCAVFNDLIGDAINNLPKETREEVKGRVTPLECRQYPGPEELSP